MSSSPKKPVDLSHLKQLSLLTDVSILLVGMNLGVDHDVQMPWILEVFPQAEVALHPVVLPNCSDVVHVEDSLLPVGVRMIRT